MLFSTFLLLIFRKHYFGPIFLSFCPGYNLLRYLKEHFLTFLDERWERFVKETQHLLVELL